ncbi:hypothetical protein SNE40_010962 [Patella caerulea]|uniref:Translation initiation factor IF-2, mitochondrial n=1 Tax=Patella caerulea TaxID=87958 RepID=A0AAN8JVI3_PATCE
MSRLACITNVRLCLSQIFPLRCLLEDNVRRASCIFEPELTRWGINQLAQMHLIKSFTTTSIRFDSRRAKKDPIQRRPKSMKINKLVSIKPDMTVTQLAKELDRSVDQIFEALSYVNGGEIYRKKHSVIDNFDVIKEVVKKCGFRHKLVEAPKSEKERVDIVRQPPPDESVLQKRPPVVTIMGHVDHGKTTLLDYLRKSKTVDKEFGGITQHIGAFSVPLPSGETITFLDTPGHAAFSTMRARGAQVTDIIVLVVAADDGVMEQTLESIQHARQANVPIIVAVNKMDKPEADLERTKRMLMEHQLLIEEFGGDVQAVPISALKGTNIQELKEAIITQSEIMEIKGDPVGLVEGRVIESKTDPGRGKLVTAVVKRGTLKKGSIIVAGKTWAKVRGMFGDDGKPIVMAPPSTPVEISGWKELPSAGDEILEVDSEKFAKEVVDSRLHQALQDKADVDQIAITEKRAEHRKGYEAMTAARLERGFRYGNNRGIKKEKETIITHEGPQLSLVLKGDVDGSLEAILDTLVMYNSKKCNLDLIHYGVGNITEQDIKLAESFDGVVMGFNVSIPSTVQKIAESCNVPVSLHQVIYNLFDDLCSQLNAKLPVIEEQATIGEAKVLQLFKLNKKKKEIIVAGCRCTKGLLHRKKNFKVIRDEEVVYEGSINSLKHLKNEVETIKMDVECGLSLSDSSFIFKEGDIIQCFDSKQVTQVIDWDPGF